MEERQWGRRGCPRRRPRHPLARGWTRLLGAVLRDAVGFPAHAGMTPPLASLRARCCTSPPRAPGDGPSRKRDSVEAQTQAKTRAPTPPAREKAPAKRECEQELQPSGCTRSTWRSCGNRYYHQTDALIRRARKIDLVACRTRPGSVRPPTARQCQAPPQHQRPEAQGGHARSAPRPGQHKT